MHDALEVAQAAADHEPKNAEAWALLGRVARYTGMPAASDLAFHRAAGLTRLVSEPYRVHPDRFDQLVDQARESLSSDARRRLERTTIRAQALPDLEQVREGTDPDTLVARTRDPQDVLTLFQVNHENRAASEEDLRALIARSLSQA